MTSNTFCPYLWNHQMIDGSGRVKPCCRFDVAKLDKVPNLNEQSLDKIFYSDLMDEFRNKSRNGERIEQCHRCYTEEDGGKKSLRQKAITHHTIGSDIDLDQPKITYVELAISNHCNLACRMCDSRFSHRLYEEEIEYSGSAKSSQKYVYANLTDVYKLLPNLKFIKFTGGEPLVIPEHWNFLESAIEQGYAKNISLNYATNGTVWPKEKYIKIWKEFKDIELMVSIDSVVPQENEYQRHHTDHSKVIANFNKYIELGENILPMNVIVRPTVTIYNVYNLPELLEYLASKNVNFSATHLSYPLHQQVSVLPQKYKDLVNEKYNAFHFSSKKAESDCRYIQYYMNSKDDSNLWNKFLHHTEFLDKSRGQSFKETYPYFDF